MDAPDLASEPVDDVWQIVRIRAQHAALEGWEPLDHAAAEAAFEALAAQFEVPASVQFEDGQVRRFYAALDEDDDLLLLFALVVQTHLAARNAPSAATVAELLEQVHEAERAADAGQTSAGLGDLLRQVQTGGAELADRLTTALRTAWGGWYAPFSTSRLATGAPTLDTAQSRAAPPPTSRRQVGDVKLAARGWSLHATAQPEDRAQPSAAWVVEVGLQDTTPAKRPVRSTAVLLAIPGEPELRTGITDAAGIVEFHDVPSAALTSLVLRVPAADEGDDDDRDE
jgi:hypothetical protein